MSPQVATTKKWDTWEIMHKELGCYSCHDSEIKLLGKGKCCERQRPPADLHLNGQTGGCLDIVEIKSHE